MRLFKRITFFRLANLSSIFPTAVNVRLIFMLFFFVFVLPTLDSFLDPIHNNRIAFASV